MLATAAAAGTSQPVLAGLLALGASGLAGAVVAMAWSVHARQIRLAELLARRQFVPTREPAAPEQPVNGHAGPEAAVVQVQEALETVGGREAQAGQKTQGTQGGHGGNGGHGTRGSAARPAKLVIEGPETVVVGEQVRYRVRPSAVGTAVTWAAGVNERRETKSVTAVPDVTPAASPFPLRLFLQGWGLVVVAVLVVGFAGALDALGNLTSGDFIALVVPLTALLGVLAAVRGTGDPGPRPARNPAPRPGHNENPTWPES